MSLAVAVLLGLARLALAQSLGFDHAVHADKAKASSGVRSIECARCHQVRGATLVRPGHAACFGACHGPAPTRQAAKEQDPARLRVCTSCHIPASLAEGKLAIAPITRPDFALAFGHRAHGATCAQCHTTAKRPPHQRCAGCHDGKGKGAAMTACAGCHAPSAAPSRTGFTPKEIVVTSAFSHARHAARGGAGKACATCHASLMASDTPQMPLPTAGNCAIGGCHDGKASFSPIVACTKCHKDVPTAVGFKIARPAEPYSHTRHQGRGVGACLTCHSITASGEILINGHAVCAGCHDHAEDFGRREPKICGACHNSTEPWRALVADRSPLASSEFGATIDHKKHASPCAKCHSLATATAQLRPPRGHASCTGTGCHAKTGGVAPKLATCDGCHQLGLVERRVAQQLTATWSVRARFDHTKHTRDQAGNALPCVSCHVDLTSPTVQSLTSPPKSTCAPCHDGGTAFKLTGTSCTRCHPGAK
ncbi:MAG: cytochrome c3 family protein [Kofleriaceae bacterium]